MRRDTAIVILLFDKVVTIGLAIFGPPYIAAGRYARKLVIHEQQLTSILQGLIETTGSWVISWQRFGLPLGVRLDSSVRFVNFVLH